MNVYAPTQKSLVLVAGPAKTRSCRSCRRRRLSAPGTAPAGGRRRPARRRTSARSRARCSRPFGPVRSSPSRAEAEPQRPVGGHLERRRYRVILSDGSHDTLLALQEASERINSSV